MASQRIPVLGLVAVAASVGGYLLSRQAIGYIFPSDFAIDGLVRTGQLSASLWEVARDWSGVWILALVYFALAAMSAAPAKRRRAHD